MCRRWRQRASPGGGVLLSAAVRRRTGRGRPREVTNLTSPGPSPTTWSSPRARPPRLVRRDVVFHEKGLQPAVDEVIDNDRAGPRGGCRRRGGPAQSADGRADDGLDPHFWLDPTLLAEVADAFTKTMTEADPATPTTTARQRAAAGGPDGARRGLPRGPRELPPAHVVVSHDAFGYLGRPLRPRRAPDRRPLPRRRTLAAPTSRELSDLIRADDVTTVFTERLASPKLADTLASDLGIETAVLDPIEGLSDADADDDYLSLMRENLAALAEGRRMRMSAEPRRRGPRGRRRPGRPADRARHRPDRARRARWSRCSGPTARASPPWSRRWSGCTR